MDLKLLDFGGPMGESQKRKLTTPRKERRIGETDEDGNVILGPNGAIFSHDV